MNFMKCSNVLALVATFAVCLALCQAANLADQSELENQGMPDNQSEDEPMNVEANEQVETDDEGDSSGQDPEEPREAASNNQELEDAAESNIANAKIDMSSQDMSTAAGHHHHHGHYPHGMMKMGAHTGKKGSFGWHSKHPVGGKGRR